MTDIVPELVAEFPASELKEESLGGLSRRGDTNTLENSVEHTWRGEGREGLDQGDRKSDL